MRAIIFGIIAVTAAVLAIRNAGSPVDAAIMVGGATVRVEIANEASERFAGLSGRPSIPSNSGMLFVFDAPGYYPFVMRDMRFGLDFVWIDENRRIVHIDENISQDHPDKIVPPGPIQYVLEVNAGWAKANGAKIGDRVEIAKKLLEG